jgi:hypothetical protein
MIYIVVALRIQDYSCEGECWGNFGMVEIGKINIKVEGLEISSDGVSLIEQIAHSRPF